MKSGHQWISLNLKIKVCTKQRMNSSTFLTANAICFWVAEEIKESISTRSDSIYKKAKLQARIKPIALCSAIDKENSIEFPLDFLYYLYNYYIVCVLLSHVSQTSFGHISINSPSILTVSMATESP